MGICQKAKDLKRKNKLNNNPRDTTEMLSKRHIDSSADEIN
jgi:hypothetical protein